MLQVSANSPTLSLVLGEQVASKTTKKMTTREGRFN
jgi:hypothetical protein